MRSDKLFPLGAFAHGDTWYVYYIANGVHARWNLGIARDSSPNRLRYTAPVLTTIGCVIGGADVVRIFPTHIALFIVREFPRFILDVKEARTDNPPKLGQPIVP